MDFSRIPTWVWIAGGGVLIGGAFLLTRKASSTDTTGQNSQFTDLLSQLMDSLANLQGNLKGNTTGGGTTSSGGGTTSGGITSGPPYPAPKGYKWTPLGIYGNSWGLMPITPTGSTTITKTPTPIVKPTVKPITNPFAVHPLATASGSITPHISSPLVSAKTVKPAITPIAPSPIQTFQRPSYTQGPITAQATPVYTIGREQVVTAPLGTQFFGKPVPV